MKATSTNEVTESSAWPTLFWPFQAILKVQDKEGLKLKPAVHNC